MPERSEYLIIQKYEKDRETLLRLNHFNFFMKLRELISIATQLFYFNALNNLTEILQTL